MALRPIRNCNPSFSSLPIKFPKEEVSLNQLFDLARACYSQKNQEGKIMTMVMGERKHGRRISVHGFQFMNSRSFPKKRRINAQRLELQQKGLEKLNLAK